MLQVHVIPNVFEAEELRQCWREELRRSCPTTGFGNRERELERIELEKRSHESGMWSRGWVRVNSLLQFDPISAWSVAAGLLEVVNSYETRSEALTGSGLRIQTTALREGLLDFQIRVSTLNNFGDSGVFGNWEGVLPTTAQFKLPVARAELSWFEAQTVFLGAMVAVRERDEFWRWIYEMALRACASPAIEPEERPGQGLDEIAARTSAERALPRETRAGPTGPNSHTDAEDPDPSSQSRRGVGR